MTHLKLCLSLRTKIIIACGTLFFLFCWIFAVQTLYLVNHQTAEALYESASSDQYNLSMSIRTYVENQTNADITQSDQMMRSIKEFTASYRNQNSYYYITEEGNRLVAFTMPLNYITILPTLGQTNLAQHYSIEEIDGRDLIFVSSRVRIFDQFYHIHYGKDITDTVAEQNQLALKISLFLISTSGLLLFVLYLLIRHMFLPFLELSGQAKQMALGNYSLRVHVSSQDEIGLLANDFNQMAEAVQHNIEALEKTIKARELFSANLSHELKTPLTSIIGYADLGDKLTMSPERLKKIFTHIKKEGMRLNQLSETLLLWSQTEQREEIEKETCLTNELLSHIRFILEPVLEGKDQNLQIQTTVKTINVSKDLFTSLLINLCINASKASQNGTVISLCFDSPEEETLRLKISDQGIGIPLDEVEHIMEPFYMVDKERDRRKVGSGLGLAICKTIVQAHGGTITIKSEKDKGTCVTVLLPNKS